MSPSTRTETCRSYIGIQVKMMVKWTDDMLEFHDIH